MGFLSFLSSRKDKHPGRDATLEIDLVTFRVGRSKLGMAPAESDFFAGHLRSADVFEDANGGIEIGTKAGVLDYALLNMEKFRGQCLFDGANLEIGRDTPETVIREKFGEPYWIDRTGGEVIMFYEYTGGSIELQFELPDGRTLGFVTLSRHGVLSCEEQRKTYGVDKHWPPE